MTSGTICCRHCANTCEHKVPAQRNPSLRTEQKNKTHRLAQHMANPTTTAKSLKAQDRHDRLVRSTLLARRDGAHGKGRKSESCIRPWETLSLSTPLPIPTNPSRPGRNREGTQLGKVVDQLLTLGAIWKSYCCFLLTIQKHTGILYQFELCISHVENRRHCWIISANSASHFKCTWNLCICEEGNNYRSFVPLALTRHTNNILQEKK